MSGEGSPEKVRPSSSSLVLFSLVFSRFSVQPPGILTGLLLVDIGLTFGLSVGVTGQLRTISYALGVLFGLLMGVISLRFRHRSLLMIGLILQIVSALGCGLAPSFDTMLGFYSLWGVSLAMVSPMTITLVGEHFAQEKRPGAIGWIVAGMSISYVVGGPSIGMIAGLWGWRWGFLAFALPISVISLLVALVGLPTTHNALRVPGNPRKYLEGFKGILLNRSAGACVLGTALSMAAWMAILVYSFSFLRQRFLVSTGFVSIITIGSSLSYTIGGMGSGRIIKRLGRKPSTAVAALLAGLFAIAFTVFPNLWLSVILSYLGCFFAGMRVTASSSLTLEQVPKYRGTMMSVSAAADNLGSALGSGLGGLALLLYNYEGMAAALGSMGIMAALIFHFLSVDPTRARTD